MSENVFIFGAGASAMAGVPLMDDFLDVAESLLRNKNCGESEEQFVRVFDGIKQLQRVHSKTNLEIHNLESIFSAFEMAHTLSSFSGYSEEEIETLVRDLRYVIATTVQKTTRFPRSGGISAPEPYGSFVQLVSNIQEVSKSKSPLSLISFNYDIGLDYALFDKRLRVNYGFSETAEEDVPLLKLHGSVNWTSCTKCREIVPISAAQVARQGFEPFGDFGILEATPLFGSTVHCGAGCQSEPVIVPPTWNKSAYSRDIRQVWRRAARELSDAENIFVIGFSLPESDSFFRYLFALSTMDSHPLKRFWVFNPDVSVENRFRALLGQGVVRRFSFLPKTFAEGISDLYSVFPETSSPRDSWAWVGGEED